MNRLPQLVPTLSILAGLALAAWLVWDATALTARLGLDPAGGEAIVALAGLVVAVGAVGLGLLGLWRGRDRSAAAEIG